MKIGEHYKIGNMVYRAVYMDTHRILLVAGEYSKEISPADSTRYPLVGVAERIALNNKRVEAERITSNRHLLTQLRLI